jgi:hypothetical protein
MIKRYLLLVLFFSTIAFSQSQNKLISNSKNISIGSRLELFADYFLIDTLINTSLKLHEPIDKGPVLKFNKPWEGQFSAYVTIIKDDEKFRAYYRGVPEVGSDGNSNEVTCYAESDDGITWIKPNLKLYEVRGTKENNVILSNAAPFTHNFSPFLDNRKDVNPKERYKAIGGLEKTGLVAYISEDGINWNLLRKEPIIIGRKSDFDSQNVAFWSESEEQYICYYRTWVTVNDKRYRSIARVTSKDFINWSEPIEMDFGDTPIEHLYTNQTSPYFRAPHLYVSIAARFMPHRQVLSDEEAIKLNVNPKYFKDCSDAIFMTTRGGNKYDRTFMEGFIRPGIGLKNWVSRTNYPALNVVQTSPTEISIYVQKDYAQPTAHLNRYTLRLDGFASINAPYNGGEIITKAFKFSGKNLLLNMSTSAAGFIKVEILDTNGNKIKGFELDNCKELIGNEIAKTVVWKGNNDLSQLKGTPIRLRFVMKDADLYSMKFENE